jgi:hypothetical protein
MIDSGYIDVDELGIGHGAWVCETCHQDIQNVARFGRPIRIDLHIARP